MSVESNGDGSGISADSSPCGHHVVDDGLWAELTVAVATAAAATLTAPRTVRIKADHSPVTEADECSQALLVGALTRLMPGVAIVSEEMAVRPSQLSNIFILLDPLDGTREFIGGSGEFTVNLAVMKGREPVAGIVAVPAAGIIYRGCIGRGAEQLAMPPGTTIPQAVRSLRVRTPPPHDAVAEVSRSHLDPATVAMLDRLHIRNRVPCGSALKFCRVAEGAADIYPRLAPTREWDVAAGHALIAAAGGAVTRPDGGALLYGDTASDFRVPSFVAWGDRPGLLGAARK